MTTEEVSAVLDEMAVLLELKGENPFKARAYSKAARIVKGFTDDVAAIVADGRINETKGIGKTLASDITELVTTGRLGVYDELKASLPPGLLDMTELPGLGPKRIRAIYEKLGVKSVGELEYACRENRLASLSGFGEKTQANVLKAIEFRQKQSDRHLYHRAHAAAEDLLEAVRAFPGVERAEVAGSVRRQRETVGDLDIVASARSDARTAIMDAYVALPGVEQVVAKGDTKSSVRLKSGMNADLRVVGDDEYPFTLAYFTGSKEHNTVLRGRAKDRGLRLNEYALGQQDGSGNIPCGTEEEVYKALGLPYIEPELRENLGEFDAAEAGTLPKLVELSDIRGILHVHTTYSDGANTVEEMAHAVRDMGFSYLGIADHSQSAAYAGGLSPDRVREQWAEIDALNARLDGFVVLKGIESDIRVDGSLDYDDELLAGFDFVVASVHSKLSMSVEEATARILTSIRHPATSILGHPTARLLLAREGYKLDMPAVIAEAAKQGVAIELNASPHRLDLDWTWCRMARSKGVRIAIDPDSHSVSGLPDIDVGVAVGRKGWLEARDVLNALPVEEFRRAIVRRH